MRLKLNRTSFCLLVIFCSIIQFDFVSPYRTEVEVTPEPTEETTTKKSGFFGGIKNFFRSSPTTTTTEVPIQNIGNPASPTRNAETPVTGGHKPPPLNIPHAPLVPLGPRPDTPSSPIAGNSQQPPQWPLHSSQTHPQAQPQPQPQSPFASPQLSTSTTTTIRPAFQAPSKDNPSAGTPFGAGQRPGSGSPPNFPPGFSSYQPSRPLPSGLDLSYGGTSGRPQAGSGHHGAGLAPMMPLTSSTTTTTPKSVQPQQPLNIDLRGGMDLKTSTTIRPSSTKEEFPPLPVPRRPSSGTKEDFPALPTPKSPIATPTSPLRPSSPSAWNVPLSTPATTSSGPSTSPSSTLRPQSPAAPSGNRVSFVPHTGSTTTVRPGFQSTGNSLASDDEIREVTETLFTKEVNSQLSIITVNPQGKTRSIDSTDEAPLPLLQVNEKALEPPTIAKMRLLFNNYEVDTQTNEHVTPNERKEENDFLDAVMATSVMRQTMLFLQNKGLVTPDPKTHRDLVKELWFTQYSRGNGKIGSSGFEHVFVNEVKNGTLIGLHNWVYFYDEEKANRLDYKGYINQIDLGSKGKVLKVRFTHNGLNKPVNTLFIGTSPELELALYTLCFQLRPDRTCPVSLGNSKFGIVTYSWRYRGKSLIGSAYPEI